MNESVVSLSLGQLGQLAQNEAISDRKKKWRIRILSLLLKGDKKNKSIKSELVKRKIVLAQNLVGNIVQGKDINAIFRLYDKLDQDIFVPAHVKYISNKFKSQVKIDGGNSVLPLFDYLALLSFVRVSLADFIQDISLLKTHTKERLANIDAIEGGNASSSAYNTYDTEQYYDEFKRVLFPLYEEAYPEGDLDDYKENLYSKGKIDPARVVNFLAKISHYPQKESLLEKAFAGIDRSQEIIVNDVHLSLDELIAIVRSLHISLHIFSPE